MFPYLLLVGLARLRHGRAELAGRFFAAALGPAMLNVGMIAAVLALAHHVDPPVLSLAFGVLLGGVGQLLVQVPDLRRTGLLVAPSRDLRHPALIRIARLLLPAVFGLAAVQVMVFVNTLLRLAAAGRLDLVSLLRRPRDGVPAGDLRHRASPPRRCRPWPARPPRATRAGVAGTLNFALRLAVFVSVPATVGLVLLSTPITRVLFQRGRFGPRTRRPPRSR